MGLTYGAGNLQRIFDGELACFQVVRVNQHRPGKAGSPESDLYDKRRKGDDAKLWN